MGLDEGFASRLESSRREDTMEGNVVLAHELVELHIRLRVGLPPFSPVLAQTRSSDGDVSYWSFKPDIKDFFAF